MKFKMWRSDHDIHTKAHSKVYEILCKEVSFKMNQTCMVIQGISNHGSMYVEWYRSEVNVHLDVQNWP